MLAARRPPPGCSAAAGTEAIADFQVHNGNAEPQGFGHIGFLMDELDASCAVRDISHPCRPYGTPAMEGTFCGLVPSWPRGTVRMCAHPRNAAARASLEGWARGASPPSRERSSAVRRAGGGCGGGFDCWR